MTDSTNNRKKKIATLVEAFSASPHDKKRQEAALHLIEYLKSGAALLARCENLLETMPHDQFGSMSAAARLMQANARVAEALSRLAPAEQRRRSVVLHITDDRPTREELIREIEAENAQSGKDVVKELEERLDMLLERERAAGVAPRAWHGAEGAVDEARRDDG